jgi:hypothetical protein
MQKDGQPDRTEEQKWAILFPPQWELKKRQGAEIWR